jgi:hypothetical protein
VRLEKVELLHATTFGTCTVFDHAFTCFQGAYAAKTKILLLLGFLFRWMGLL